MIFTAAVIGKASQNLETSEQVSSHCLEARHMLLATAFPVLPLCAVATELVALILARSAVRLETA